MPNRIEDQTLWMRAALHDLSQPLSALECRLFIGTMDPENGESELRETIFEALAECQRMMTQVRAMQERLNERMED